jgi:predicted metal-dependent enzyme (double-stranded beta helix superfamily)
MTSNQPMMISLWEDVLMSIRSADPPKARVRIEDGLATATNNRPTLQMAASLLRLANAIDLALRRPPARLQRTVMEALSEAVASEPWLPPERRRANHDCFERHLLYGDPEGKFSILSLVWNHGQHSPIHSHRTWCAMAVYNGEFTETIYQDGDDGSLREVSIERRGVGSVTFDRAMSSIHRVDNRSGEIAISLHVYGVGPTLVTTDVNHVYPAI